MAFPSRALAAPATAVAPPAPPAPPMAAPAPPAPPAAAPSARNFWCSINGAVVLKTEAETRALAPSTAAMAEDQAALGVWSTLAVLCPAPAGASPAAAAPQSRAAFGQRAAPAQAPVQQQGMPKGIFAGVENAEVIRRGNNINPGDYICKLCSSEFKQGRQKNMVITELEVIKSSYEAAKAETHGCNREGSRMTNFVSQNDSFVSNIKEIILAASGFDAVTGKARDPEDTVTQAECEALVSPEQPYAGALVYIEAREVDTRAGGKFTRVSWWPCPLQADGSPDEQKLFTVVR